MPQNSVVQLVNKNALMVVKTKFIEGMNSAEVKNEVSRRIIQRKVLIPGENQNVAVPNLSLKVSKQFCSSAKSSHCYLAFVLSTFGIIIEILSDEITVL